MTNCPLRVAARHACFLYPNVHPVLSECLSLRSEKEAPVYWIDSLGNYPSLFLFDFQYHVKMQQPFHHERF